MKKHQLIFDSIKRLLVQLFDEDLTQYDEGTHLTIGDSEIWISVDDYDLTVGYGLNHRHFHSEYDDLEEAIDNFFNLLTRKKRITKYYKGEYLYKDKVEVENEKGEFNHLSSSMTWFFPFWMKTQTRVEIIENLIDYNKIEIEIQGIKSYLYHRK